MCVSPHRQQPSDKISGRFNGAFHMPRTSLTRVQSLLSLRWLQSYGGADYSIWTVLSARKNPNDNTSYHLHSTYSMSKPSNYGIVSPDTFNTRYVFFTLKYRDVQNVQRKEFAVEFYN